MSAHTATQLHINEFEDISRRSHGFWTKGLQSNSSNVRLHAFLDEAARGSNPTSKAPALLRGFHFISEHKTTFFFNSLNSYNEFKRTEIW